MSIKHLLTNNLKTDQKLFVDTLNSEQLNATNMTTDTFNATNGTIATLNSTNGTITTLNSTNGTITTLNSTIGTIGTLNSTIGTIGTLNSTMGTIDTLNSTTISCTNLTANNTNLGTETTLSAVRWNIGDFIINDNTIIISQEGNRVYMKLFAKTQNTAVNINKFSFTIDGNIPVQSRPSDNRFFVINAINNNINISTTLEVLTDGNLLIYANLDQTTNLPSSLPFGWPIIDVSWLTT